jgi:hypothetical protein
VLYLCLNRLIIWPDRAVLIITHPLDFKIHCPDCVVIIDCFEIIDRPTDLLKRSVTYTQYTHHKHWKVSLRIQSAHSYTIMTDETKDISKSGHIFLQWA